MSDLSPEVVLLERRIEAAELRRLVLRFEDLVKYVADVEQRKRIRDITFALVGEGEPV